MGSDALEDTLGFTLENGEKCDEIKRVFIAACKRKLYARELKSGEFLAVFPSLGALCNRHYLIVPETPYHSFAEMEAPDLEETFSIINELRRRFRLHDDLTYILAEHGAAPAASASESCPAAHQAGACVDHAHFHLLPTFGHQLSLRDQFFQALGPEDVFFKNHIRLHELSGQPYLMLSLPVSGKPHYWIWKNPTLRLGNHARQFVRRAFHAVLPEYRRTPGEDGWNWRKNPALEHVQEAGALLSFTNPYNHDQD